MINQKYKQAKEAMKAKAEKLPTEEIIKEVRRLNLAETFEEGMVFEVLVELLNERMDEQEFIDLTNELMDELDKVDC